MSEIHITSLLRTRNGSAFYQAIEAPGEEPFILPAESLNTTKYQQSTQTTLSSIVARNCVVQHVDVEFVPTLNFVFQKTDSETDSKDVVDSATTACADIKCSDDISFTSDDNKSTHTYIISRSNLTVGTTSSSTPYAVTSTNTSELLRRQNNLSLTEDDQTLSSFSIEQPTSSMSIKMAEQREQTTAATTRSDLTSSVDLAAGIGTTTTTSSSIEEDIEEVIDLSEVEEQLHSNVQLLSEAAAYATPKYVTDSDQQSAKLDSSEEEDDKFRIDDAQLSGAQLAQHFLIDDLKDGEDVALTPNDQSTVTDENDDEDFDISLPLEQLKALHSLHEDESRPAKDEGESLSNQSTTDDVSDFLDEPHPVSSATEAGDFQNQEQAFSTAASASDTSQAVDHESQQNESVLDGTAEPQCEHDHSIEDIVATNESIELTYEPEEAANSMSLHSSSQKIVTDLDVEPAKTQPVEALKLSQMQMLQIVEPKTTRALDIVHLQPEPLDVTILEIVQKELDEDDYDDEECSLQLMKLRLMAMNQQTLSESGVRSSPTESLVPDENIDSAVTVEMKQMERVPLSEFSKDVLEDITEESERLLSLETTVEEPQSISLEESKTLQTGKAGSNSSLVSLNMLKQLEAKMQELHTQLESKDSCITSLNMQLETARRESSAGPASARDSSSLITSSTEYRTFQEELGAPTLDIYVELSRRDEMIAKLTKSLEQSLEVRSQLQSDADQLDSEVQILRKQLHDTIDMVKRSGGWPEDAVNIGQRISEISMDLISESDDDIDRFYNTDHDGRGSRSSRDRQLSAPRQSLPDKDLCVQPLPIEWPPAFSKQIEQFQKCLLPGELRPFLLAQRKFDDYMTQQLTLCQEQCAREQKINRDQWESEKLQSEQVQQAAHAKQMEELRKYFEHRCADLEKQFSDDVFSHKSQHINSDTSSECSEAEQLPSEVSSKESSPRKRKRAELLLSPSHRQITPSGFEPQADAVKINKDSNMSQELADLKQFYQTHIREMKRSHDEQIRKLTERQQFNEHRQMDDDYLPKLKSPTTCQEPNPDDTTGEVPTIIAHNLNTSLIVIDKDELNSNNEAQVIQRIMEEYERRLQEQLALARQDIVGELEQQIQSLLSESAVDDQHWPKELILLREKFTAKSQLEITQLNIKHADEMSRLKLEYEKQLNRKNKRHLTFDAARDLEHIISERDGLRELSKSFRSVLCRLAKCVANCEDDLNATLSEEVQRILAHSRNQEGNEELEQTLSNSLNNTKQLRLVPDVHSLLEVVEDPSLLQFIDSKSSEDNNEDFDLGDCLERLKLEAAYLLQLSEDLDKPQDNESAEQQDEPEKQEHEQCCEAEDGLKTTAPLPLAIQHIHKLLRTNSLNDQHLGMAHQRKTIQGVQGSKPHSSLPVDLQQNGGSSSELGFQLIELKNRLIKSETDRQNLQQQLMHTIDRNAELGQELQVLREQLSQLSSLNQTDYAEGYGLGDMKDASTIDQSSASFVQLQERARQLLTTPTQQQTKEHGNSTVLLLQMIEDFCREGDKVMDTIKKDREDLQSQIDTADKQLKATRLFLEDQAAEREQERDEFQREIEQLKAQLRDMEKERSSFANASEEYAQLEAQLGEVNQKLGESNSKCEKFELELKASIDKIFVLREIISELETQVQTKALNEQVLSEKSKQLEDYVNIQMHSNDALQQELHSLKRDIGEGYEARIRQLEDKLQQGLPSTEQSILLNQMTEQLRDIESTLIQKTKTLESLHNSNTSSNSCSLSATEDVSVHGGSKQPTSCHTTDASPTQQHSLTVESIQRVAEKLEKHTRVEEAAIKRIRDLEMQVTQMRSACVELQNERDLLQGRFDEQTHRISTLQKRLEEQRQSAEQLHRAGTSDLNTRVHELQNEICNLGEQLAARDKQMGTMQQQLERSKDEIIRLERQLTVLAPNDRSNVERLEAEVHQKNNELHKLKEKVRTEMINRLALPDLMETVLADKNDEIDHLRAQLEAKDRDLKTVKNASQESSPVAGKQDASTKHSARTLSDIGSITEFPEPDVERRATMHSLNLPLQLPDAAGGFFHQTMETSKEAVANLTYKRTDDLSGFVVAHPANTFEHPHYFQDPNALAVTAQTSDNLTPGLVPRQINFSNLTEDSKLKTPSMLLQTPELPKVIKSPEVMELKQKLTLLQEEKEQQKVEMEKNLTELRELLSRERDQLQRHQKRLGDQQKLEEQYRLRIDSLETKILEISAQEAANRDTLRRELNLVSAAHAQCEQLQQDTAANRNREVEALMAEINAKTERNIELAARLQSAHIHRDELMFQVNALERDLERMKNSEQSSKQYSVDEIAQQVAKELNYSAQLDSNILKAIESEEENNLDHKLNQKEVPTDAERSPGGGNGHGTDDENFTGERELLNQLETFKAQLAVEREQSQTLSRELFGEKQHSQEIQEQDVLIIEAMRKRLEAVLEAEDELHKQLDMERERCDRLQTQLTSLQRAESRRGSLLLKSPTESPRKTVRGDVESELCDRLRSELKLLTAQYERERERSADAQRNSERERQRYEKDLQERIAYCERLKQEMDKLVHEKETAEIELEHFNERLTLQANEIESLEARMVTLQETETRRANTRARQHQEEAKLQAEILELKSKLLTAESAKENLEQKVTQLRFDVTRSAQRELKLSEALAQVNDRLAHSTDDTVPAQFLQKMKDINTLLAENTQENRQMAETVQYLVGERIALQKKCEELGGNGNANVCELEERCRQLLGRYLRVESHRKALVYQKRYLKLTLEGYQASEQLALQSLSGAPSSTLPPHSVNKKKLFKTVALVIIAIQRIKYIGRIWHTGKRIVSKSVFTITQQRAGPCQNVNVPASSLPLTTQKSSPPTSSNNAGCLSSAPSLMTTVNFSSLQPIILAHDYTLQTPVLLNNNNYNTHNNNKNINYNNNNNNDGALPSLSNLDWPTTQKTKRAQSRLH